MNRIPIKWRGMAGYDGKALEARSHKLVIGFVLIRMDGSVHWSLDSVKTKWIVKGSGEAKSVLAAKRALARAWSRWCKKAGLN